MDQGVILSIPILRTSDNIVLLKMAKSKKLSGNGWGSLSVDQSLAKSARGIDSRSRIGVAKVSNPEKPKLPSKLQVLTEIKVTSSKYHPRFSQALLLRVLRKRDALDHHFGKRPFQSRILQ